MSRYALPLMMLLVTGFSSLNASAAEPETKRDVVVEKHDMDGNKRLDGKEMKAFKNENPKMYENLVGWCKEAKDAPKKHGVDLPAKPNHKQKQCKKKHVSRLYLNGWTAEGQPVAPERRTDIPNERATDGSPR